jgi:hypothetical protein
MRSTAEVNSLCIPQKTVSFNDGTHILHPDYLCPKEVGDIVVTISVPNLFPSDDTPSKSEEVSNSQAREQPRNLTRGQSLVQAKRQENKGDQHENERDKPRTRGRDFLGLSSLLAMLRPTC